MFTTYIGHRNGEKILSGIARLHRAKKGGSVDSVVDTRTAAIDFVDRVVVGACGALPGVDLGSVDLDMEY